MQTCFIVQQFTENFKRMPFDDKNFDTAHWRDRTFIVYKDHPKDRNDFRTHSRVKCNTHVRMLRMLRTSTKTAGSFILMAESMAVCRTYQTICNNTQGTHYLSRHKYWSCLQNIPHKYITTDTQDQQYLPEKTYWNRLQVELEHHASVKCF
jgi:hypothetical protein